MDFYLIRERSPRKGILEIFPDFMVARSKDLMTRGKSFYAIWDENKGFWSTDEYDVARIVDADLRAYSEKRKESYEGIVTVKYMSDFSSNSWSQFRDYLKNLSDNAVALDENLTFLNTPVSKKDHVSKRLAYPLEKGTHDAFDELISTLYDEKEKEKLEWAIGSIVCGDSKEIQKFVVLYGEAGGGKSTILNIIQWLFHGYYTTFEAKALTSYSSTFSTEVFKSNPLVAIQHDGDLSGIEDNTRLNSIISHEEMTMNEKFKPSYTAKSNSFLFVGSNKPVKISDSMSGIIRRLIDVRTSGRKVPTKRYQALMSQIQFELGGIAFHCLEVYRNLGKNYYSGYKPLAMMLRTDIFYNFVDSNFYMFKNEPHITLNQAYELYKTYCDESNIEYRLPRHKFRDELANYFEDYADVKRIDGKQVRSIYSGFKADKFNSVQEVESLDEHPYSLVIDAEESLLDEVLKDSPAQYASSDEIPARKWLAVTSTLKDLDTKLLHYVKAPHDHIVIDFDLEDDAGNKSTELNLEAASKWPPTYAEYSKGGKGIHLHYIYDGDLSKVRNLYSEGIEIKIFNGDFALRRKLTKCNRTPIAHLNSGLPLKGEKMIDFKTVRSERGLRDLIERNLRKEIHPGTKPSIDFIFKILEDAYASGMRYDVTQLRPKVLAFASNSSHQPEYCISMVSKMKFQSEERLTYDEVAKEDTSEDDIVFFDVEVFSNLFLISWKYKGPDKQCVRMINPMPSDIENFMKLKLVGFNNRRYDNHILYARYIGYDNDQLYELSQRIIGESKNALFREAYNVSFADVYDFSSIKQSLKLFEVQLGLTHKELGLPWDQPVPEDKWSLVAEYCDNDVIATEAVFEDRRQDYVARCILAELSGLAINDNTQAHTAKILFGNDPNPQDKFVYTNLAEQFPGYIFDNGKSSYRGEDPKEGGYVYAEPGIYDNVALLDVASMHPSSILAMNMFGKYTIRYKELLDARLAIKRKEYDKAKKLLNGMLAKYLDDPSQADQLAYALKIHALNIVYGLTYASFPNKFKDPRNIDNIVAKRGALFMIDLKLALQEKGIQVIHIKTDSVKIPNATPEIIEFVNSFGKNYGYTFEHEATYSKLCLVNDAVYIARDTEGKWTAVGAQFAHPVVFKTLFSKEDILFEDLCETRSVTGASAIYLDMNEDLVEDEHNYIFIGKVGRFVPILSGSGGGLLYRKKDDKYYAVTGTKGYRWLEAEVVKSLNKEDDIDHDYHKALVDKAKEHISDFGNFKDFIKKE
jgi:hypothetical protein